MWDACYKPLALSSSTFGCFVLCSIIYVLSFIFDFILFCWHTSVAYFTRKGFSGIRNNSNNGTYIHTQAHTRKMCCLIKNVFEFCIFIQNSNVISFYGLWSVNMHLIVMNSNNVTHIIITFDIWFTRNNL